MFIWREAIDKTLTSFQQDQFAQMLLRESNLTEKQLLAFLIDISAEEIAEKNVKYEEKARSMPEPVSRGAYNRTLLQARRNVVKSFFTLYLLGYMGLMDLEKLSEHIQLGEELKTYITSYLEGRGQEPERGRVLNEMRRYLVERVNQLAQPSSLKPISRL